MSNALERVGFIALAVGLYVGCRGNYSQCEGNTQCSSYEYCVPDLHVCALRRCHQDVECGNAGICNPATWVCEPALCEPGCLSYQGCLHGVCAPIYGSVTLDQPVGGIRVGRGGTDVAATLHPAGTLPRQDPRTLLLKVDLPDGGVDRISLEREDGGYEEGRYSGTWRPLSAGMYQLSAHYEEANLPSEKTAITADFTPPTLRIVVQSPPTRRSGNAGVVADENDPDWLGSWRRDETVPVKIVSNKALAISSVRLLVYGIADGGVSEPSGPFYADNKDNSTNCAPEYCYEVPVNVSVPTMNAGRGVMQLVAAASDTLGNDGGIADAGMRVTRLKWVFTASATDAIKTSPAIGQKGTVYFGTSGPGASGGLWAVAPDGTKEWMFDGGAVEASPAVGTGPDGGTETIYFGANYVDTGDVGINKTKAVAVVMNEDGNEQARCPAGGPVFGSPALGESKVVESAPVETVYFNVSDEADGSLIAVRPGGRQDLRCVTAIRYGRVPYPGEIALHGSYLFYGDDNSQVHASSFGLNGSSWEIAWVAPMPMVVYSVIPSTGEIFVSGNADRDGGVATMSRTNGAVNWNLLGTAAWNAVLGSDGRLLFADATPRLTRIAPDETVPTVVRTKGTVKNAPLIAEGGVVYTASAMQPYVVEAFSPSLEPLWSLALRSSVTASVAVDCSRDVWGQKSAGPGTLYVATTGGQLYAIITDTAGIDTTAPWPKYQHDPRNTGNVGTDLSEFACP